MNDDLRAEGDEFPTVILKRRIEHNGGALLEGSRFGVYRIRSCLGRGGMGEVYEVEHCVLGQRFALKVLMEGIATSDARNCLVNEAKSMGSLRHPGIIRVDDFGETEGRVWLRMELAEGVEIRPGMRVRNLSELLLAGGGRLGPGFVASVIEEILEAVQAAHDAGLVHRDLKPTNILLDGRGRTKISDFGLVQIYGDERLRKNAEESVARRDSSNQVPDLIADQRYSRQESLIGTWEYMSPEQKHGSPVDARSDLFAVGLVAFRMLTGKAPVPVEMPSDVIPAIDPAWDIWWRKAVARLPQDRYLSATEMIRSLRQMLTGSLAFRACFRQRSANRHDGKQS